MLGWAHVYTSEAYEPCLPRHGGREFVRFLQQVEGEVPPSLEVHLIMNCVRELEKAIYEYLAAWNEAPKPFVWKATADSILGKVKRRKELNVTGH